jgi:Holliday junction DNA helicase RuvA
MIGYLRGTILRCDEQQLLLDVGGVGYELQLPLSTFEAMRRLGAGATTALYVHTHVREDALQLFGFAAEAERQLFLQLITVSGIGPRLAQTILSGMAAGDLVQALANADLRRLSTISGVGKKTAERLVVELKDKAQGLRATLPAAMPAAGDDELVMALVNLGYRRPSAELAVAQVEKDQADAAFPERLRAALKLLSRTG